MAKDAEIKIIDIKEKFVKKATSWVRTSFWISKDGKRKQKQEWFTQKEWEEMKKNEVKNDGLDNQA